MYKHGVYVQEQETSLVIPQKSSAGLQVIFGTAPVNLADDPYGCTNKPMLCYSFKEAASSVGYSDDFENYTLCQSIDACFRVFNTAPVILVNVLDPSKHKKSIEETVTLENRQALIETKGILPDTVVVKSGETELTADVDYTISFDDNGSTLISIMASSSYASSEQLSVRATAIDPTMVDKNDIIGAIDLNTGKETGLEVLRQIYPSLGMVPGVILAPGWSQDANVAAAMQAKCTGINGVFKCSTVIDIDCSKSGATKYQDVKLSKESQGVNSENAYAVWPKGRVGDKVYYMSALAGACISFTDAQNDDVPAISPSNKSIKITAAVLEDGTEILLDQEQANQINSYGVATALNMNGFKLWGNSTAVYPSSTDPKDRWYSCRRFFSWYANNLILTFFQKVDNPINYRLIESIVDSANIQGNYYVARGYCARAEVVFSADENPITEILNGRIVFHLYLSPYPPAEDIEFVLEFDPTAIETALNGGE